MKPSCLAAHTIVFLFLLLLVANGVSAGETITPGIAENPLCHVEGRNQRQLLPSMFDAQVNIQSNEMSGLETGLFRLTGNVSIMRDGEYLDANEALYNSEEDSIIASGDVLYRAEGLEIIGDEISLYADPDRGQITQAKYKLFARNGRGRASRVLLADDDNVILKEATYTTCVEGNNDWYLRASTVELDQASGIGSAYNTVISFKRVPFFYLPYINFPIDDRRKSGMLVPNITQTSEGIETSIPFYLNIAPNLDAVVTLDTIPDRGNLFQGAFRYLTEKSEGFVDIDYLGNDRVFNDDRSRLSYRHTSYLTPRLTAALNYNEVSDVDYFDDFGRSLSRANVTHIEREAHLHYRTDQWQAQLKLQDYQMLDDTVAVINRPYQRLPQLTFDGEWVDQAYGLNVQMDGEYTLFEHELRTTGERFHLMPGISLPLVSTAAYFTPSLAVDYTMYDLRDQLPSLERKLERSAPVLSVDSGLFFDRLVLIGQKSYTHTLEPRLFYLNVPYRDQADIPIFDSSLPDFGFASLFRTNRFTGLDRLGDANQVSLAVTSRLLENESGKQRLVASLGRIIYLSDRRVDLAGDQLDRLPYSNVVAELTAQVSERILAKVDMVWDSGDDVYEKGAVAIGYRAQNRRVLNLSYRYRHDSLEQTDVSFAWPIGAEWDVVGRRTFSLRDDHNFELLYGLEYKSCCWKFRVLSRRYINDTTSPSEHRVMVQLELNGLTGLGQAVDDAFESGVLGYEQ